MFTRVEARRFRSLQAVDQELGRFRVLVGPNGSGKTTFLDVLGFLSDLLRNHGDIKETVLTRSTVFHKLLWLEEGSGFELAVEADIPESVRERLSDDKRSVSHVRYEVEISLDANEIGLAHETLWLRSCCSGVQLRQPRLEFPKPKALPPHLLSRSKAGRKAAIDVPPS